MVALPLPASLLAITSAFSGMKTLVPENRRCVSICAIIWLGARDRYVGGENTALGFHGAYNKDTGQPGSTMNVKIAVYLGYLDLSYDAVDWILGAPMLAIRWLTPETSKQYGIYYSEFEAETLRAILWMNR